MVSPPNCSHERFCIVEKLGREQFGGERAGKPAIFVRVFPIDNESRRMFAEFIKREMYKQRVTRPRSRFEPCFAEEEGEDADEDDRDVNLLCNLRVHAAVYCLTDSLRACSNRCFGLNERC